MARPLPTLLRRIVALLLLLLDLGQEPASAFPLLPQADEDNDSVTELCTRETFWRGLSADELNVKETTRSKQQPYTERGSQNPQRASYVERVAATQIFFASYTQSRSDVLHTFVVTSIPLFTKSGVLRATRTDRDPSLVALETDRLLI